MIWLRLFFLALVAGGLAGCGDDYSAPEVVAIIGAAAAGLGVIVGSIGGLIVTVQSNREARLAAADAKQEAAERRLLAAATHEKTVEVAAKVNGMMTAATDAVAVATAATVVATGKAEKLEGREEGRAEAAAEAALGGRRATDIDPKDKKP